MLTKEQRDELRRAAERATPGPWISVGDIVNSRDARGHLRSIAVAQSWDRSREIATFIAAANPAAVLALLDALDAAELARDVAMAKLDAINRYGEALP